MQKMLMALRTAAAVGLTVVLASCGGGGGGGNDGNANVRVLNATQRTLSLLVKSESQIASIAVDTASAYAEVDSGSPSLQINDATTGTAVATLAPSVDDGKNYAVLAYESGGIVRATVLGEDATAPAAGTAVLRVFDAASESGAVDVYVTDPATDITTLSSPTFTFTAASSVQESVYLAFTPGTYRVRVTGSGNTADLRLDIPSVTLASQAVATVVLTPTTGGTLVNGALVLQQGAYTATRNTSARVRLAAAVTPGATVAASVGTATVASAAVSPSVGAYTVVPAATPFTITVNGAPVASPATALAAGTDATLVVYGSAAAPTATLLGDDNRLPASTSNLKMRLFNGITGATTPLTLSVDFAVVASNVAAGAASAYAVIPASASARIEVTAATTTIYAESGLNIPGNAVYTLFMLGDTAAPVHILRRDR